MSNDMQTIEVSNVFHTTVKELNDTTATEVECPTCGFSSKQIKDKEYECQNGHRFKD